MRRGLGLFFVCALLFSTLGHMGCGSEGSGGIIDDGGNPIETPEASPSADTDVNVVFTPVGPSIASDLIDIEFLPGQNGESIVIGKGGQIYYLRSDLSVVGSVNISSFVTDFEPNDERGLLNVAADPLYNGSSNRFVYFYYTSRPSGGNDTNQVIQFQVSVNTSAPSFSLSNPQGIIAFTKTTTADNHNGGSMVFMNQNEMAIGVGDGGDTPNLAQDPTSRLGKLHRIIPRRTGAGGYDLPANNVSVSEPSIYSMGVRNPFTLAVDEDGDLFMGDVGANAFEEVNCVYFAGENYGWPTCEGDCPSSVPDPFQDPIHGYAHGDDTFNNQDPQVNSSSGESILVNLFYQGTQYNGLLNNKLIYSEFFAGWVRLLTLDALDRVTADQHIGHLEGMTSLQMNPADNLLYGVSLFGSDQIQRMDLLP